VPEPARWAVVIFSIFSTIGGKLLSASLVRSSSGASLAEVMQI
jgi:hypothetical protein